MTQQVLCYLLLLTAVGLVSAQRPVSARFAGGTISNFGIVEVTMSNGQVGRICDIGFDSNGASAICAMMGYRDITGFKINPPVVTTGSTTSVMAVTQCPGFLAGSTTTWTLDVACNYVVPPAVPAICNNRSMDVGVICTGTLTTAAVSLTTVTPNLATVAPTNCSSSVTNLRLEPGPQEGVVVIRNGTNSGATNFGTICANGFGVNEATTICRMLCQNATTNAIGITGKYLTQSALYPVMLSGLTCPTTAASTNECKFSGWGVADAGCTSVTAITVRCDPIVLTPPPVPNPTAVCQSYNAIVLFPISQVANASLLTLYGAYNASTCNFTTSSNGTTVWAVIPYVGCNSVQTTNATHVIYTSYVYKNVTPVDGVYKDTPYVIPVSCAIPKVSAVSAALVPDARTVTPIYGGDSYSSEVRLFQTYTSGSFLTEIAPGQKLFIGSKIYARVQVTSPLSIRLTVNNCYASDTISGTGTKYYMVQSKCATTDNAVFRVDDRTIGINFVVISFTSGVLSTQVYVFCDVIICTVTDTDPKCQQICGTAVRRKRRDASSLSDSSSVPEGLTRNGPFQIVPAAAAATSAAEKLAAASSVAVIIAAVAIKAASGLLG